MRANFKFLPRHPAPNGGRGSWTREAVASRIRGAKEITSDRILVKAL